MTQAHSVILKIDNITKLHGQFKALNTISLEINRGEIFGLLGPNGAGKTTSFYMMVGMVKPTSGRVFMDSRDITSLAMYKRARLGMSYLPQEASIFRKLSVEDNILKM